MNWVGSNFLEVKELEIKTSRLWVGSVLCNVTSQHGHNSFLQSLQTITTSVVPEKQTLHFSKCGHCLVVLAKIGRRPFQSLFLALVRLFHLLLVFSPLIFWLLRFLAKSANRSPASSSILFSWFFNFSSTSSTVWTRSQSLIWFDSLMISVQVKIMCMLLLTTS